MAQFYPPIASEVGGLEDSSSSITPLQKLDPVILGEDAIFSHLVMPLHIEALSTKLLIT